MSGPGDELGIAGITDAVEIGSGGFGTVYRAVEDDLGRTVAVKVLTGNLDEGARYRFERERRAMGRLSGHPNIVTVYRSGFTNGGNAYLVMEFLDRGSLADRLTDVGAMGWQETLKFAVQLSGALETSHRAGVLHRDIKPGNILLSSLGNAKLCDFGIARLQGAPETKSSVITASLSHAPPDIVSGARPDARSDVYSLASTMFELVTTSPPFVRPTDESMVPILARITQDPVPTLSETVMPGPMFEVVAEAMSKDPDDRPPTAAAFAERLVEAQRRLGLAPTPIPIEAVAPGAQAGTSAEHVPFPETDSGPLPAPSQFSPSTPAGSGATTGGPAGADAGPPVTGPRPGDTSDAAATMVNPAAAAAASGEMAAADATMISSRQDPAAWAPPVVSGPASDGPAGDEPSSTAGRTQFSAPLDEPPTPPPTSDATGGAPGPVGATPLVDPGAAIGPDPTSAAPSGGARPGLATGAAGSGGASAPAAGAGAGLGGGSAPTSGADPAGGIDARTNVDAKPGPGPGDPPPDGGDWAPPATDTPSGRRPGWLVPVGVAAAVIVAVLAGLALVLGGGGDDGGDTEVIGDADPSGATTDTGGIDGADGATGGDGGAGYSYEEISDITGSIVLQVPTAWADRDDRIGSTGERSVPTLAAAPQLEDGYYGTYNVPGVQVAVTRTTEATDFDAVLERWVDPNCISQGRDALSSPYVGRIERFTDCGGGDTALVHAVYVTGNVVAVIRVQIVSEDDRTAADVIRNSLELNTEYVPE